MTTRSGLDGQVATVRTTPGGAPERFVWEGHRYVVVSRPIPWLERVPWWDQPISASSESGSTAVVERRMWQVEARDLDTGEILTLDLAIGPGQRWSIVALFD